ncbi:DUF7417 domain-containing protein [Micromonospora halotolerans]|uniref:DUF7417 domain-containing protein n=1 Tax=Micromonospora halotolerans TaxID=709879 RepID=UPI00406BB655
MVRYERGLLDDIETCDLFQRLVDTGLVWGAAGTLRAGGAPAARLWTDQAEGGGD